MFYQKLASVAQLVMQTRGDPIQMAALVDRHRLYDDVRRDIKAAVGGGTLADATYAGALAGYQDLVETFVESLRSTSIFDRMLTDGALRRIPLQTRVTSTTAAAIGTETAQTYPKPVSSITLGQSALERRKASTILVLSEEVVGNMSPAALAFIDAELRAAVSAGMNAGILSTVAAGLTPTTSSGTDAAAVLADVAVLLGAVGVKANSRPYLVTTSDVATQLLTMPDADGVQAFPGVTTQGGELCGIPLLVSDEIASATMMLLDASRCAGDSETITLEEARHASLVMDTAPSQGAAQVVSMFQTNSRALKAERWYGFDLLDDTAAALIDTINYSGPV